jgi:hypothetical protein
MKTKVFAHKGFIGILSNPKADGLVASPITGSFGCVISDATQNVEISKEALEALKSIPKGHDSLGEIDIFGDASGKVIFGWMGGFMGAYKVCDVEISREYNPSLLTATEGVEAPQDFIDFVEAESK